jgi:hypothetical protein
MCYDPLMCLGAVLWSLLLSVRWSLFNVSISASLLCLSVLSQVKVTLRLTVSQSVSLDIEPHLGPMTRYLFLSDSYVLVSVGHPLWREDGSVFSCAAGSCQRSLSRVLVPWDLRPYFAVSELRLPFSSPPTTRRVTVEVFDPASTRVLFYLCLSSSQIQCLSLE